MPDNDQLLHKYQDKVDHIQQLVDLEWNGRITITEFRKRVTEIVMEDQHDNSNYSTSSSIIIMVNFKTFYSIIYRKGER